MSTAERNPRILDQFFRGRQPPEREFPYRPPIALVKEDPGLDVYLKAHGMKSFRAEGIPGRIICPDSYEVNLSPLPHNNGSHAKYYIDGQPTPNGDVVFVYTLEEGSRTSNHTHEEPLSEDYFLLYGTAQIGERPMQDHVYIPSDREHQVTTSPDQMKVLVMAVLRNGAHVPPDRWHSTIEK